MGLLRTEVHAGRYKRTLGSNRYNNFQIRLLLNDFLHFQIPF